MRRSMVAEKILLVFLYLFFSLLPLWAEARSEKIGEWDFRRMEKRQKSFSLRGKSRFSASGVHIPLAGAKVPGGTVLKSESFPVLENAFSIEAEIVLEEKSNASAWRMIIDKKYIPVPRTEPGIYVLFDAAGQKCFPPGGCIRVWKKQCPNCRQGYDTFARNPLFPETPL